MRPAISIRPYEPADAEACAGIFDRAWRAGHPFAPRRIDAAVLAAETEGETLFVAEDESGDVVGFVSLYRPESFVHHLYVEPHLRNRGIGRALLDHAVAIGRRERQPQMPARQPCRARVLPPPRMGRGRGWDERIRRVGDAPQPT